MSAATQALSADAWTRPAVGLDTEIGQLGVLTDATVHEARLEVCSRAVDAAEARTLLAMLDLLPGDPPVTEQRNTVRTEANRRRREARARRTSTTTGDRA